MIYPATYHETQYEAEVKYFFDEFFDDEEPLDEKYKPRRTRTSEPITRPANALRTPREAAARLRCSVKTLFALVADGLLRYVAIGQGKNRQRKMFTDADLDEFIENQTRKDAPCPSSKTTDRHSTDTTSKSTVIGFTAARNARRNAKPKR